MTKEILQLSILESFYRLLQPVTTGYPLIRLGRSEDGGYLVPNCLSGIQCCISPGVCEDFELEEALANCYGIHSVMCDPQHDPPEHLHPLLHFERLALSAASCPDKKNISLNDLLEKHNLGECNPLMLSMDIEGAEYVVLPSITDWHRFRIVVIEIHFLPHFHTFTGQVNLKKVEKIFKTIFKIFDVVHFSPNNHVPFSVGKYIDQASKQEKDLLAYACIELTLLNKCMRKHSPLKIDSKSLPHFLDRKNDNKKPEVDYHFYDTVWNRS